MDWPFVQGDATGGGLKKFCILAAACCAPQKAVLALILKGEVF